MKRHIGYKYRIYPTAEQEILLAKTFGCKRVIYNHYLDVQKQRYLSKLKHLTKYDINLDITKLKREKEWLRDVDDYALKYASEDITAAFNNFFTSLNGKRKGPKVELPRYKEKSGRQSYRTRGNGTAVLENAIKLPKLKLVKAVIHNPLPDDAVIKSVTVSKNPDGRYYAAVLVETDVPTQDYKSSEVGFDLGLKDLMITSNGLKFLKPDALLYIARTKQLLKRRQRQFSRAKEGSKNREKLKLQVARLHSKITRQRNEYYHILSKYLVGTNDVIYMENLAVSNMLKNRKISRAVKDIAWSTLVRMIEYKAEWAGVRIQRVGRFFPSSKTCSCCGHKLETLKLDTRKWTCPSCNTVHDRDLNAAMNILYEGQRLTYGMQLTSQATGEAGEIPMTLQKMTSKIERPEK